MVALHAILSACWLRVSLEYSIYNFNACMTVKQSLLKFPELVLCDFSTCRRNCMNSVSPTLCQMTLPNLLLNRNSSYLESYLDPAFMSLIKDPDQRRKEQWERTIEEQNRWNCFKMLGYGDLGGPPLSAAEEYSLHSRYLAKANSANLTDIAEMKIM